MSVTVRGHIVRIGNSQGIRIPKALLEQSGLGLDVEIEVLNQSLVIRSAKQPRLGWDEAFAAMSVQGDDVLLEEDLTTDWDQTEWEW